MVKQYKELLITNELNIARKAKSAGQLVVLSYPLSNCHGDVNTDNEDDVRGFYGADGMDDKYAQELSFSDFPYAIENAQELDESYLDRIICRMKGIPCHIVDTDRCRIREIVQEDVDELYLIYSEPGITDYMEPLYEKREDEIAYTRDYIRYQYGFYDFGMWIIEDKENGKIIGRAGFDMRQGYEEPEIGYLIRKEYQNKGYATEVCKKLLFYGKTELGFSVVRAFTSPKNRASVKLLEKLGFEFLEYTSISNPQKERRDREFAHYRRRI